MSADGAMSAGGGGGAGGRGGSAGVDIALCSCTGGGGAGGGGVGGGLTSSLIFGGGCLGGSGGGGGGGGGGMNSTRTMFCFFASFASGGAAGASSITMTPAWIAIAAAIAIVRHQLKRLRSLAEVRAIVSKPVAVLSGPAAVAVPRGTAPRRGRLKSGKRYTSVEVLPRGNSRPVKTGCGSCRRPAASRCFMHPTPPPPSV